jgi:hypothetical protein
MAEMKAAVEALASATSEAWAGSTADIVALWDEGAFRFYKAEEVGEIFHCFDQAVAYWRANEAMHEAVRLQFSDVTAMPLDGRYAAVTMKLRWDIRFSGGAPGQLAGKAMGGTNHVVALVTDSDAGLRWAAWSETPDAAITYLRQLYERQANI